MSTNSDMMSNGPGPGLLEASFTLLNHDFFVKYRRTIYELLQKQPELKATFPAFLLFPDKINIYFGSQHLALEFVGPHKREESEYENNAILQVFDYRDSHNLMDDILGLKYDGNADVRIPLSGYMDGLFAPSSKAFDILVKNGWNFAAEDMLWVFNTSGFEFIPSKHTRLVNCFFLWNG